MIRNTETKSHSRNLYIVLSLIWAAAAVVLWSWFLAWTSRRLLTSLFLLTLLLVAIWRSIGIPEDSLATVGKKPTWRMWAVIFLASIVLLAITAQPSLERLGLLAALSLASFMVGCLAGFLFTSYGEEKETVGKVKDWLIGGITGLTITQASSIKSLLGKFAFDDSPHAFAVVAGIAILYVGVGFFFMFLERELVVNIWLAAGRAERGRFENTEQVGQITLRLIQALPPEILSGIADADELVYNKEKKEEAREQIFSPGVNTFLDQADEASKTGADMGWDVVSKVSYLRYYRIYFSADEPSRLADAERARQWILRALNINPLHVDLTAKYADTLGLLESAHAAINVLLRLERWPSAPAYVRQWLGYYLLKLPGREDEAIRFSKEYLQQFPDDTSTPFNLARAYARKYNAELRESGKHSAPHSENRKHALEYLEKGLCISPDYMAWFKKKWLPENPDEGPDWKVLRDDEEFKKLIDSYDPDSKHHKGKITN
jgi:tetratricopeptide (TPR) repeat protein